MTFVLLTAPDLNATMATMAMGRRTEDRADVAAAVDRAAAALAATPTETPTLFPTSLFEAHGELGVPTDPLPLLRYWAGLATGEVGRIRYRWSISPDMFHAHPTFIGPKESWAPWRPRDRAAMDEDPSAFGMRVLVPLVVTSTLEWLGELAEGDGEAADLARRFIAESRTTARRDAAFSVQERHAWGDTWALWCMARHPHVLRLLHPFALAIAEAYADTTIEGHREAVVERRFPFAGVPLVSASSHLAAGLVALGAHPKLTGTLATWVRGQQHGDGGFGDSDGPSDLLTTLVAADLLSGLDPTWDPMPTACWLATQQTADGWWRAYGPEAPWLTLAIWQFLRQSTEPFPARFRWPEIATTNRDRRTGLAWYAYYADMARLCQEVPGLGDTPIEVAFLDLAGFGVFNNRHGMAMGDAVLREFAQALAEIPGTMAIRDGGDEFLSLGAPGGTGLAQALDVFRRAWPTRLTARFGPDAKVAPRILVTRTTGAYLVEARDDLGRRIAELKVAYPLERLPPEGILVEVSG